MEQFNILLSFPRSGNTWVRYVTEFVSKQPTTQAPIPKCIKGAIKQAISADIDLGVDVTDKAILIKRHRADFVWDNFTKDNCRLVLLIRNYKEAILRHAEHNDKKLDAGINNYIHCLSFYDAFKGDKIYLHYEDILVDPKREFGHLMTFLHVPINQYFSDFIHNYDYHKTQCLKYYKPGTMTGGTLNKLKWHTSQASPVILNKIMKDIKSNKELYSKYLKRYG
jgi:hypothetical protein